LPASGAAQCLPARFLLRRLCPKVQRGNWARYLPVGAADRLMALAAPTPTWRISEFSSLATPSSSGSCSQPRRAFRRCCTASSASTGLPSWADISEDEAESASSVSGGQCTAVGDVLGCVWEIAQHAMGTRRVQDALEGARCEAERVDIAWELRGHVSKAMRCPHANHILQKCINTMRPENVQFIVDEIAERECLVTQAAKHRYACRVVQHLLRRCSHAQVGGITKVLLKDADALACHTFGSYVVQQMLEFGSEDLRRDLSRMVQRNVQILCPHACGSRVVRAALEHAAAEDRARVACAVAHQPEVLRQLAAAKNGEAAIGKLLDVLQGSERECAIASLRDEASRV